MLDDVTILYSCKFKKRSLTWEKADAHHQMVLVQQVIHLVVEEIALLKNNSRKNIHHFARMVYIRILELIMTALKQDELFNEIDILPIDLKTEIVNKILASITPINASIDALWIKEANKRKQEIESNSVTLVNGDEVFKKISQRLHS